MKRTLNNHGFAHLAVIIVAGLIVAGFAAFTISRVVLNQDDGQSSEQAEVSIQQDNEAQVEDEQKDDTVEEEAEDQDSEALEQSSQSGASSAAVPQPVQQSAGRATEPVDDSPSVSTFKFTQVIINTFNGDSNVRIQTLSPQNLDGTCTISYSNGVGGLEESFSATNSMYASTGDTSFNGEPGCQFVKAGNLFEAGDYTAVMTYMSNDGLKKATSWEMSFTIPEETPFTVPE